MDAMDMMCVNTMRFLSVDAISKASSGHPGMAMGAAPMGYALWSGHLKHNPKNPHWENRDRFILSAGHGSMLLYSMLHLFGYKVSLDDIRNFRQWGSNTPGHPEYGMTDGVEATSGPLGQGVAMAVGLAMAEAHLGAMFNRPEYDLVDHYTYALCGDACLMEGVSGEACSLAGTLKLGKLIVLYDQNNITIEGPTDIAFDENVKARYESYGWQVLEVPDGDRDLNAISAAITLAKADKQRPSLIMVKTTIGYGCPMVQGECGCHGSPLSQPEINAMKTYLHWDYEQPFTVPQQVYERMASLQEKFACSENQWNTLRDGYKAAYPELWEQYRACLNAPTEEYLESDAFFEVWDGDESTRVSSGKLLNKLAEVYPQLMGGSADLSICNMTELDNSSYFSAQDRLGRNIHFGVREFAMAAICNGMALHGGILPYCGTFLVFFDYLKSALRMSAMMKQRVIYILSHDSIGMGEDGITHQPVEQLAELRATPGVYLFRPADAKECAAAYACALRLQAPSAFSLTRQTVRHLAETGKGAMRGGYVVYEPAKEASALLIATGSELAPCLEAARTLEKEGISARVVSMPCTELFDEQEAQYRQSVLPERIGRRLVVEAATSFGWSKYAGCRGEYITLEQYGASAPAPELFKRFGFTAENIIARVKCMVSK